MLLVLTLLLFLVGATYGFYYFWDKSNEQSKLINELQNNLDHEFEKYKRIIDLEQEIEKRNLDLDTIKKDIITLDEHIQQQLDEKHQLDADLLALDCGLYTPHFDFDTSERYKAAMMANREMQKMMINNWDAIKTSADLKSRKKSLANENLKKLAKLMLRAFNGECDAIMEAVRWNNVLKMVERIKKMYEDINNLSPNELAIKEDYLKLKIEDLYLTYEYKKKIQEEKEEQARIREQMREERKIQEEIERKERELREQENRAKELQNLLDKARLEGLQEAALQYENQLQELQKYIEDNKRSISNAQQTKHGTVYVISNIGSFGENIYKIGLTRRDNPMERVDELGDASVPFKFDVHAFIESDNAPQLEYDLHEKFKNKSVNRVNYRKEFFKVSLNEIIEAVNEHSNNIVKYQKEFTDIVEAQEYRETQAILKAENQSREISLGI